MKGHKQSLEPTKYSTQAIKSQQKKRRVEEKFIVAAMLV